MARHHVDVGPDLGLPQEPLMAKSYLQSHGEGLAAL